MDLSYLLVSYGYWAVLVGCLLEGETILLLAGFAARQGYLSFALVVALAFLAGSLGDLLFFLLGKYLGARLIARYPRLAAQVDRVNVLLLRHQRGIIVSIRFMYGLRIAGPIIIGNSGVPVTRFMLFNMIGAAIWAPLVAGTGYLFGATAHLLFADLGRYQWLAMLGLVGLLWGWHGWRTFMRQRKKS
ncbi:DedA family protein [Paludibacterium purpuratum]|uniref:Membrane protein DedA with SNARE-associated domain n=1 Tax=Paludibacterium purpuratum TaxID=1144873 RepID=A0A4R7BF49_9NEIS|nr:DedA family protein [Paludibacterium purpuratum]TDR82902.1 membrane protein DedA with SNARE-associated domain [Paludibacterium purpuratum]